MAHTVTLITHPNRLGVAEPLGVDQPRRGVRRELAVDQFGAGQQHVWCVAGGVARARAGAGGVLIPGRMCECGPTVTERPAEMLRIHGLEGLLEAGRARLRSGGIEPVRD